MRASHCICPSFLSRNIGDSAIFYKVFIERLLMSEDQIVLDEEERLATSYMDSVKQDRVALENYIAWRKMLDGRDSGKTLVSSSANAKVLEEVVYNTITKAVTSFDKSIIVSDNNQYSSFIGEINRQRIQMFSLQNLTSTGSRALSKRPEYAELEDDIEWILQRLARRSEKTDSEDYNNDYLRDMLSSKTYEVKDQTREGTSMSGLGAGELDLVLEERGRLFTLIEAMKLTSVDSAYINKHYLKLLKNYNPLQVKRTFLITYYTGSGFANWWGRYKAHIAQLDMSNFVSADYSSVSKIVEQETEFLSVKKMHHHLDINGEHSLCTHFAILLDR